MGDEHPLLPAIPSRPAGREVMYHGAAKIVKPKMDALKVAEAKLSKVKGIFGGNGVGGGWLVSGVKHGEKTSCLKNRGTFFGMDFSFLAGFWVRCLDFLC